MNKFSLDNIDDVLTLVDLKCPEDVFDELTEFQYECEKMDNCYECWYRTVATYQYEQSLKSKNDNESEDK